MKKICLLNLLILFTFFGSSAQDKKVETEINKATFDYFEYKGNDAFFKKNINSKQQYFNPIIAGFYPDPSICRKGDDYYLVNSSFSYYPGIPIWHSKDLVNWKQIGYVLNRPSQLKLNGLDLSEGVFAPTIRYNEANNTFYVICTVVGGIKNFIVKTQDLSKGWSEPILLPQVKGIDPSIFFDDNGKAYITNGGPPTVSKYKGYKAIWLYEYDTKTDKLIDAGKRIAEGGIDTTKHSVWLEGPHIYKVKNKYYLMCAEGGTGEEHSEVIFESDKIDGDYKPCAINSILTQRDLEEKRPYKFTSTGHADLIQTKSGAWYAVFLATRPYANDHYNTGRETCLLPVAWKNNIPIILDSGKALPVVGNKNDLLTTANRPTGNFFWKDEFTAPELLPEWNMIRTPEQNWYLIDNGKLILSAIKKSIYDKVNPAFLGRRQQHITFSAKTAFTFTPKTDNELAGMVVIQNENNNMVVGKTIQNGKMVLLVENRTKGVNSSIAMVDIPAIDIDATVCIYLEVNEGYCDLYYSFNKHKRQILAKQIDIKHLSTKEAGGFVGSYVGVYATANRMK